MKSILKSELIKLLDRHRDNDVLIEFDGYDLPIEKVYYDPQADQIRIVSNWSEVNAVKMLIHEKGVRAKVGNANLSQ